MLRQSFSRKRFGHRQKAAFAFQAFFAFFFVLFHGILYGALLHFSSPNSEYPDRRNPKQIAQTMNHLPFVGGQRIVLLQADEEGEPAGNLAAPLSPPATGPRPSSPPPTSPATPTCPGLGLSSGHSPRPISLPAHPQAALRLAVGGTLCLPFRSAGGGWCVAPGTGVAGPQQQ